MDKQIKRSEFSANSAMAIVADNKGWKVGKNFFVVKMQQEKNKVYSLPKSAYNK